MSHVYFSYDWHARNVYRPAERPKAPLFDWTVFADMTLAENSTAALAAVASCSVFAAVFHDREHRYQGTFELLAAALALGKPVLVYVDVPEVAESDRDARGHRWATNFDRFLLYHPGVRVYTQGEEETFFADVDACHESRA